MPRRRRILPVTASYKSGKVDMLPRGAHQVQRGQVEPRPYVDRPNNKWALVSSLIKTPLGFDRAATRVLNGSQGRFALYVQGSYIGGSDDHSMVMGLYKAAMRLNIENVEVRDYE